MAVVMVLQRIEGCSDQEAADRFAVIIDLGASTANCPAYAGVPI